jgi:tetratricopeptide (TPR) repeat protein
LGFHEGGHNHEQAMAHLEESESLYRELGHLAGTANVLRISAQLATWQGDYDSARPMLEESLALAELLGERGINLTFIGLGLLYWRLGDYQQARAYLEKGLSISQQIGERLRSAWTLVYLGHVFLHMGEMAQARQNLVKSFRQFKEADNRSGMIFALEGLARLAASREQAERAVRLFAWADGRRQAIQSPRPPIEQADVDRDIAVILEMIDEEAYAAAYAEGKSMTIEQAIAHATEDN